MNKLIISMLLSIFSQPVFAQNYTYSNPYIHSEPCVNYNYQQPTCTYTTYPETYGTYPSTQGTPVTRAQYPGALDPVRNLPAWSYNP